MNYNKSSTYLSQALKIDLPFLKEVSSVALQQMLRNQDKAFQNFYKKTSRYPKFKSKRNHQSFRLVNSGFRFKDGKLYIAKSKEPLKIKWHRYFDGIPKSIIISKNPAGQYFVSILVEEIIESLPEIDKAIGIDLGLENFLIDSNGNKVKPLHSLKNHLYKLKILQRRLSKKQKGSNNREKARLKVAKLHQKITNIRLDFLHKLSTQLIRENQTICVEDLSVKDLIQNKQLSRNISDASWSKFIELLEYKARWYGRTISKIDRFYPSSQICSNCGDRGSKKPLSIRSWQCDKCGSIHDRDINAAKNILTAGMAELACGADNLSAMKQEALSL